MKHTPFIAAALCALMLATTPAAATDGARQDTPPADLVETMTNMTAHATNIHDISRQQAQALLDTTKRIDAATRQLREAQAAYAAQPDTATDAEKAELRDRITALQNRLDGLTANGRTQLLHMQAMLQQMQTTYQAMSAMQQAHYETVNKIVENVE